MTAPLISIVINTYNRCRQLATALEGLGGLDYEAYEVIVVNGPSDDQTGELLAKWSDRIKIATCPELNLSMSRNIGIRSTSGEIIAFIDDDAVPHPAWLKRLSVHYLNPAVGGVGGFTMNNTGVAFQAGKIVCDRYANAIFVSDFFDERPLNTCGTPHYPSLLGTNSSFRSSVLQKIGGFDQMFAYFLDETDLCLRIVDAGYQIVYEPEAIVFHQFASSSIRNHTRVAKTLYPSAVSKSYFIMRHGAAFDLDRSTVELRRYQDEILASNKWLHENALISGPHCSSLDQDLLLGIRDGRQAAQEGAGRSIDHLKCGEPPPFKHFVRAKGLRIAFVSQSFPPQGDAGIARWTLLLARNLQRRGHRVHVLTRADDTPSISFENGLWIHRIRPSGPSAELIALKENLPPNIANWAAAVRREIEALKKFGLDVISFPIWDVEGIACLDDPDIGVVLSLHTSYALAKPYKPEWNARALFEHLVVNKMIAAERRVLERAPVILANSRAIVDDLTRAYDITFNERVIQAVHGTIDPSTESRQSSLLPSNKRQRFKLVFVGRFERRKGFDIAIRTVSKLIRCNAECDFVFAGDEVDAQARALMLSLNEVHVFDHPNVSFIGFLSREQLTELYAQASIVLMPSRYESFGLVAIEAMSAGTPVIGLACGGLSEVITDSVDGFVFADNDTAIEGIVEKVLQLINDREELQRLSSAARSSFEQKFTLDIMVEQAEKAYFAAHAMRSRACA